MFLSLLVLTLASCSKADFLYSLFYSLSMVVLCLLIEIEFVYANP